MSKDKPLTNVHLICNAHLDPVWQWEWQEGLAEALSTFRVAADFCEEYEGFVFNHNEALLYSWVEKHDPELFKRIQKLVRLKKWVIIGGWYLQPDCNMPSGEAMTRQILVGRNYFREKFGVDINTAVNFDSFGHSRGLVQILAKSGYNSYLFCRPHNGELVPENFIWVGYDGSRILAAKGIDLYCSQRGKAHEKIAKYLDNNLNDKSVGIVLWGIGNHGGGPSRVDWDNISQLAKQRNDVNLFHSNPERYFAEFKEKHNGIPEIKQHLNPFGVGCYSSMIQVKQLYRQLENELFRLEKIASTASSQGLIEYPKNEIEQATKDLLFCQFHDIITGTAIQPAEHATIKTLNHGLEIVARSTSNVFFAMAQSEPKAKTGTMPVLVLNPHPFKYKQIVECELSLPDINFNGGYTQIEVYQNGKKLPSQTEVPHCSVRLDWRKRVVFDAVLEPGQINRFDCKMKIIKSKPAIGIRSGSNKIRFKNADMLVEINKETGLIDKYRVRGTDMVAPKAFEPVVFEDSPDSWGMKVPTFRDKAGSFKLMSKSSGTSFSGVKEKKLESVRIIEDGEVRTIIESVFNYNKSSLCQRYKLPKNGTEIEIETRVYWNEKDAQLKMAIPLSAAGNEVLAQTIFGTTRLTTDADHEKSFQRWIAAVTKEKKSALTCINNGIYSFDFNKDVLMLTLLRSPAYCGHPTMREKYIVVQDRYTARMDQGERVFKFWINAGKTSDRISSIDREAAIKNEQVISLPYFSSGTGEKVQPFVIAQDKVVGISAIKKAEKGNKYIVRLFEPTGQARNASLYFPILKKSIKIQMNAFEIKTFKIDAIKGTIHETDLLERSKIQSNLF